MAELIAAGTTATDWVDFTVTPGTSKVLFIKSPSGDAPAPAGVYFELAHKDSGGNYSTFMVLNANNITEEGVISSEGTFGIRRRASRFSGGMDTEVVSDSNELAGTGANAATSATLTIASFSAITATAGTVASTETSDGGVRFVGSNADASVDVKLVLPAGVLLKSLAVELAHSVNVSTVSAYVSETVAYGTNERVSRTITVAQSGTSSETHRSSVRSILWFSGHGAAAWTNAGAMNLEHKLLQHVWLRITPKAGQVADATIYGVRVNTNRKSRIAIVSDDGYLSWLQYAWPILQSRGIPSSIAIIPALVEGVNVNYAREHQLREFVEAGNECVGHGPATGASLFDYATHAERVEDIMATREFLLSTGLGDGRSYVFPQGKYMATQGDTALLDDMYAMGITLARTVTRKIPFSADMLPGCKYAGLTVPIIGYIRQGTEVADTTELTETLAAIDYCAANGLDGIIMLHNVIPVQGVWAATQSTDITVDKLISIADKLVEVRKNYGAETVRLGDLAP